MVILPQKILNRQYIPQMNKSREDSLYTDHLPFRILYSLFFIGSTTIPQDSGTLQMSAKSDMEYSDTQPISMFLQTA